MQSSQPLVSVVIPCYNHEKFVQDSIQSVIDQDYENIELIIIDDGSKDSSVAKIKEMIELCKRRFTRFEFRSRANIGLSATLNEALEWCEGEYFSAIASDDIILPEKTKLQVQYLEKNKNSIAVFGAIQLIDKSNVNINIKKLISKEKIYDFESILMHGHNLPAPTQMIRKKYVEKVGGYNSNIFIEDWYMWLKLSKMGDIAFLPIIFAKYRSHDNNVSKNIKRINQGRIQVLNEFKYEANYYKAIHNIYWINAVDLLKSDWYLGLKDLCSLFIKSPYLTVKSIFLTINRFVKKLIF